MTRTQLGERLAACQLTGTFVLRSGASSHTYFDKYLFESHPGLLGELCEGLAGLIPRGIEVLAGVELGGVPLATGLSLKTGYPLVLVRKQRKSYGTCKLAEGTEVVGRRLLLIEDVVTTGGQLLASSLALRDDGAVIEHALCVLDREEGGSARLATAGVQLHALFRSAELPS